MGRKTIPTRVWKSLDDVRLSANVAHKHEKHESEVVKFGDPWMVCDKEICKEFQTIYDETVVALDKKHALNNKRRAKKAEREAAAKEEVASE